MNPLSSRERFLRAARRESVDKTPLWLMRQAGRSLPEYRALKEKYDFVTMVRTPELAAEATLQPIRRFGFDAAVIFSDILVVPEAMGQAYRFHEGKGITLEFALDSRERLAALSENRVEENLAYLTAAIRAVREQLGDRTALLGFAGSPWTLAAMMVEGRSGREYLAVKSLFYSDSVFFEELMAKLTKAVARALLAQVEAGADAVQIFDTFGGGLPPHLYTAASGRWIRSIVDELKGRVPVILYRRGPYHDAPALLATGVDAYSIDQSLTLLDARKMLGKTALQGNLDPAILLATPEAVERETTRILEEMKGETGHIMNLGHGVLPGAKLENIERLVETVRGF